MSFKTIIIIALILTVAVIIANSRNRKKAELAEMAGESTGSEAGQNAEVPDISESGACGDDEKNVDLAESAGILSKSESVPEGEQLEADSDQEPDPGQSRMTEEYVNWLESNGSPETEGAEDSFEAEDVDDAAADEEFSDDESASD